ncbi:hypothetical protein GCM10022224_044950 [Nonomuraea antimicrobica]|uniref:Uncharacterized protein n=1 Tax=Nonomuraea antimicrobica TaxID=561173 RepID=A0ABP7C0S6_9ACTN
MLSSAAGPPDCRMDPLTDAEHLAAVESIWPADRSLVEHRVAPTPTPSSTEFARDVKAGTVAPIGVEIVEPAGCPEIRDP